MTFEERNEEVKRAKMVRFAQLKAAYDAYEEEFKKMQITRDAWINYESCDVWDDGAGQPIGCHNYLIGMIKLRGGWRLCHGHYWTSYSGGPETDIEWTPIVDGSVDDRLRAAPHIDKLREKILQREEELIPLMDKAIEVLASKMIRE